MIEVIADLSQDASANLADARRFLDVLTRGTSCTFQVFDDTPAKLKRLNKVLHGSMADKADVLLRLNAQGGGVFVMVNAGDGRGRKAENVLAVRALFVDLDGAPLEPVLRAVLPPHLVTQTSPGRWHAFWLVDGVPLDSFSHLQAQLATMFDADPSVKDLSRVMRLPSFFHNKGEPYRSQLLVVSDRPPFGLQEFVKALGISPFIGLGERNSTLFRAAARLKNAGIPKASTTARIAKMNAADTAAPLPAAELTAIIDNAYGYVTAGFSMIPHAMIDTAQFDSLSAAAAKLFLLAMRRHRPSQEFALPHSEFKHIVGLKNRKQFRVAVMELVSVGFLTMTRNYVASVATEERRCALYRIGERVLAAPHPAPAVRVQDVP